MAKTPAQQMAEALRYLARDPTAHRAVVIAFALEAAAKAIEDGRVDENPLPEPEQKKPRLKLVTD